MQLVSEYQFRTVATILKEKPQNIDKRHEEKCMYRHVFAYILVYKECKKQQGVYMLPGI